MAKTIEEILPYYLGTKLQLKCTAIFRPNTKEKPLVKGSSATLTADLYADISNGTYNGVGEFLPLLRSLYKLTNPIIVEGYNDGKPFVPTEELLRLRECEAEFEFIEAIENDIASADTKMEFSPFTILKTLLSWHFNVFNLTTYQFVEIEEVSNG